MNNKIELEIEAKTKGLEEAKDAVEDFSDAISDLLPSQIVIKSAKDCVFNIYPQQKVIAKEYENERAD